MAVRGGPQATRWKRVGDGRWTAHGTPYGDVAAFGREHAADGLIIYLEAAGDDAATICRNLHGLRLAGWFEHAKAILIGRTNAPGSQGLSQREAVIDALGRLDLPIVFDLEIGRVPPHLPLVNGALATLTVDEGTRQIVQRGWASSRTTPPNHHPA